jgi:hypothetical protein
MIRRWLAWWRWRRMRPGLLHAAMLVEFRALAFPPHHDHDPKLLSLSDDLYALYRGETVRST